MKELLPIGSLVRLKNGKKYAMIIGYMASGKENMLYDTKGNEIKNSNEFDYSGVVYPIGMIDSNYLLMFNHSDIEEIKFKGFEDEESKSFRELIIKNMSGDKDD